MICFNLLSIRLLQSHDIDHSFDMLTQFDMNNFFCLFSMRLYQSHNLNHKFYKLAHDDFFIYIILFFNTKIIKN